MRSTFLILSAAACFSALASAQENYSLWPRRPAELEQAQRLIREHSYEEALSLLAPFVHKTGLAGHESRQLAGAIRVRRYLSAENPKIRLHTVKRGENVERIAVAYKSSADLIVLINAMMEPSNLKVGQKLRVIPQDLRAELHPASHELSVWDGRTLVAAYDVEPSQDLLPAEGAGNEETRVKDRDGELNGARVPRSSALFISSNRTLKLANGTALVGAESSTRSKAVRMQQRDLNELSLLLGSGARVSVVHDEKGFDPFPSSAATAPEAENK